VVADELDIVEIEHGRCTTRAGELEALDVLHPGDSKLIQGY
jgi:hypothetical protein